MLVRRQKKLDQSILEAIQQKIEQQEHSKAKKLIIAIEEEYKYLLNPIEIQSLIHELVLTAQLTSIGSDYAQMLLNNCNATMSRYYAPGAVMLSMVFMPRPDCNPWEVTYLFNQWHQALEGYGHRTQFYMPTDIVNAQYRIKACSELEIERYASLQPQQEKTLVISEAFNANALTNQAILGWLEAHAQPMPVPYLRVMAAGECEVSGRQRTLTIDLSHEIVDNFREKLAEDIRRADYPVCVAPKDSGIVAQEIRDIESLISYQHQPFEVIPGYG